MPEQTFKISAINIVIRSGYPDKITMETEMPYPFDSSDPSAKLQLTFECPRNTGADYIRENFGVEPTTTVVS